MVCLVVILLGGLLRFFLLSGEVGDTGAYQNVIPRDDLLDIAVVNTLLIPVGKHCVHQLMILLGSAIGLDIERLVVKLL